VGKKWATKPEAAAKRNHFGSSGRRVHKPQAGAGGHFGLVEAADHGSLAANFLDVAQGFFFNGGQAAFDVALGGLGIAEVVGFVVVHNLGVAVKEKLELGTHVGGGANVP